MLFQRRVHSNQLYEWKEEKFVFDMKEKKSRNVKLRFKTDTTDGSNSSVFWAIENVRMCTLGK